MCGFLGQLSNRRINKTVDLSLIKKLISHRGPDSFKSIFFNDKVFGAFARLSITDLSINSDQPMSSPCGKYHLMFNGEIYNYLELKSILESKNWVFKSSGDTEVLLAGLIVFGVDFLTKIDGIFAFSFVNNNDGSILLARDRMGVKPLYYSIIEESDSVSLVFGSEIKFLTKFYISKPKINHDALLQFFKYKYIVGEETLVKNIKSLSPGSYVKSFNLNPKKLYINQFFDITKVEPLKSNKNELQEKLLFSLKKSVHEQFQADAKVGLQVSGGVDSTIVASIASELNIRPHDTYFVSMKNSVHDEIEYAKCVAEKFKFSFNVVDLTEKKYFQSIQQVASFHDTPINHPHSVAIYLLSKLASSKVKVLISGEGADELCFGYLRYKKDQLFSDNDILNNYSFLRNDYELDKLRSLLHNDNIETADYSRIKLISNLPKYSYINKLRLYEIKTHLQELLLRLDRMLMANSIEGRVPFLSNDMVDLCLSYDAESFYKGNSGKYQLKEIANSYMGNGFSSRRKVGFMIPLNEWSGTKEFKNDLNKILDVSDVSFINSDTVFSIYKDLLNEVNIESNMKFYSLITNLNRWMDEHSISWV